MHKVNNPVLELTLMESLCQLRNSGRGGRIPEAPSLVGKCLFGCLIIFTYSINHRVNIGPDLTSF